MHARAGRAANEHAGSEGGRGSERLHTVQCFALPSCTALCSLTNPAASMFALLGGPESFSARCGVQKPSLASLSSDGSGGVVVIGGGGGCW